MLCYTWSQTETKISVTVTHASRFAEIYFSSLFIRISDPDSKKVLLFDLLHDILFKDQHAPLVIRNANRITLDLFKSKCGMWESLVLSSTLVTKSQIHARRNSSIRDADMYHSRLVSIKENQLTQVKDRIGAKLLEQAERRAKLKSEFREMVIKEAANCIFQQTPLLTRNRQELQAAPVRRTSGSAQVVIECCPPSSVAQPFS